MNRSAFFSPHSRSGRRRLVPGGILGAILATFVVIAACSNQGEGERCQIENNNADCDTSAGLICYAEEQLTNASSDRCCPEDRSKATHPVCKVSVSVGGDATTPPNTGPQPTPPGDSGSDASDAASTTDASTDASNDAQADADAG